MTSRRPLVPRDWPSDSPESQLSGVSTLRRVGRPARLLLGVFTISLLAAGCGDPEPVQVDLSERPIRFLIDHHGWPRPFWWPRVNEFAIADDKDELIWHLKSSDPRGELAHQLAFVYGRVPPGFYQVFPEKDKAPSELRRDRTYYVAAGGERALYRMAFSLPVTALEFNQPQPPAQ